MSSTTACAVIFNNSGNYTELFTGSTERLPADNEVSVPVNVIGPLPVEIFAPISAVVTGNVPPPPPPSTVLFQAPLPASDAPGLGSLITDLEKSRQLLRSIPKVEEKGTHRSNPLRNMGDIATQAAAIAQELEQRRSAKAQKDNSSGVQPAVTSQSEAPAQEQTRFKHVQPPEKNNSGSSREEGNVLLQEALRRLRSVNNNNRPPKLADDQLGSGTTISVNG